MDFVTMIASAHPYLDRFDYDRYPDCFAEFEENCARWFTEHEAFLSHQMINPAIRNFVVHYPFNIDLQYAALKSHFRDCGTGDRGVKVHPQKRPDRRRRSGPSPIHEGAAAHQ